MYNLKSIHFMNKIFYEKPTVELLVVRFEENIMSPAYGAKGTAGQNIEDGYEYDL